MACLTTEQLKDHLMQGCEDLDDTQAATAAQNLYNQGLKRASYMSKTTEQDLTTAGLNIFQARAVLEAWKPVATVEEVQRDTRSREDLNQDRPTTSASGSRGQPGGIMEFRINWQPIYDKDPDLKKKLEKGRRLAPKDRKEIVHEIVQQVRNKVPGATRKTFDGVYKEQMLTKYKESFEETLGAQGEGSNVKCVGGILKQMKDKFDNDRRKTSGKSQTRVERECPPIKEAYGCIRWEVVNYPDGEDENSLEQKKQLLQEHFQNRRTRGAVNSREIKELMEVTYKLQRDLINSNVKRALEQQRLKRRGKATQAEESNEDDEDEPVVTIVDIRREFPFLFCYVGMEIHHELLTGIHATTALDSFCNNDNDKMLQYFATSKNANIQSISRKIGRQLKQEGCNEAFVKLFGLIWMVTVHFKEDIESLIKLVPEDTDLNTFDRTALLPSPHLLAAGEALLAAKKFTLCIDQRFMACHTNVIQTIGCIYMPYFIFNLNYPAAAQVTMEFIQRWIFKQSPEKGHKRPASRAAGGHFSSAPMHPAITRLLREVNDFLKAKEPVTSDDE